MSLKMMEKEVEEASTFQWVQLVISRLMPLLESSEMVFCRSVRSLRRFGKNLAHL
jgi:hypothetical protein